MFSTQESASLWFDIFNGILFFGAVLVAVGTLGTIKTAAVKERFSDERIAANEAETKHSVAESDVANQRAAEANARAVEAALELEKYKAPRSLADHQREVIANSISQYSGQEYTITPFWDVQESLSFANVLHAVLQASGWKHIPPGQGGAFLLGGIVGVQVWLHPDADQSVKDACNAIIGSLNSAKIEAYLKMQNPQNPKDNKIGFSVGTKH